MQTDEAASARQAARHAQAQLEAAGREARERDAALAERRSAAEVRVLDLDEIETPPGVAEKLDEIRDPSLSTASAVTPPVGIFASVTGRVSANTGEMECKR